MNDRRASDPAPSQITTRPTAERQVILQREMRRWVAHGFRVLSQTDTTAQLVKPKSFSFLLALLLVFTVVGFVIYLLWYLTSADQSVHIEIDEFGRVLLNGRIPAPTPDPIGAGASAASSPPTGANAFRQLKPLWIAIAVLFVVAFLVRVLEPDRPQSPSCGATTQN